MRRIGAFQPVAGMPVGKAVDTLPGPGLSGAAGHLGGGGPAGRQVKA
jgi:hypothetical protein